MNGCKWASGCCWIHIYLDSYIAIHAIRNYKNQRVIYWGWISALILVSLQVITGMTSCTNTIKLYLALLHSLIYHFIIRFTNLYDFTRIKKSNNKKINL